MPRTSNQTVCSVGHRPMRTRPPVASCCGARRRTLPISSRVVWCPSLPPVDTSVTCRVTLRQSSAIRNARGKKGEVYLNRTFQFQPEGHAITDNHRRWVFLIFPSGKTMVGSNVLSFNKTRHHTHSANSQHQSCHCNFAGWKETCCLRHFPNSLIEVVYKLLLLVEQDKAKGNRPNHRISHSQVLMRKKNAASFPALWRIIHKFSYQQKPVMMYQDSRAMISCQNFIGELVETGLIRLVQCRTDKIALKSNSFHARPL